MGGLGVGSRLGGDLVEEGRGGWLRGGGEDF